MDILHRVGVEVSVAGRRVRRASTTPGGTLLGGGRTDTTGPQPRSMGSHRSSGSGPRRVRHAGPGGDTPPSTCCGRWSTERRSGSGHTISWDLKQEDDNTIILFKHEGWREPVEFMYHCTTKWAVFLLSLKADSSRQETGAPQPE